MAKANRFFITHVFPLLVTGAVLSGCDKLADGPPNVRPLGAYQFPVVTFEPDFVLVRGTWRIDGERSAAPVNLTDIQCHKPDMQCRFADASIVRLNGDALDVAQYVLPVQMWDDDRVVIEASGRCRKVVTTISRADRSVVQIESLDMDSRGCETDGAGNDAIGLPLLTEPRTVRMMAADEARRHLDSL